MKTSLKAKMEALTVAIDALADDSWTNDKEEYEAGLDLCFRLKRERDRLLVASQKACNQAGSMTD